MPWLDNPPGTVSASTETPYTPTPSLTHIPSEPVTKEPTPSLAPANHQRHLQPRLRRLLPH